MQRDVSAFQRQCEADLYAAEPAIKKAEAALNSLDKASLTELKGLANPPKDLLSVTTAVQYMLAKKGTHFKKLDVSWASAKKMMGNVDAFLRSLQEFDKDNFEPENKEWVRKLTGPADAPDPTFNAEYMKSKSFAAAGLCDWVVNICIYHDIYLDVEPKRRLLAEAEAKLVEANGKLAVVKATVAALDERKAQLQGQLVQATEEKNRLLDAAARTAKRLNLAERLVNGLKDENERWGGGVEFLKEQKALLVGDAMVAASFLAYIGPFNEVFRSQLRNETWLLDLQGRDLPITEDVDPLKMLTDDATVAAWKSERLPADRLSIENGTTPLQPLALYHHTPLALRPPPPSPPRPPPRPPPSPSPPHPPPTAPKAGTIITNCSRFPLIIDPQLQGVTWVRQHEAANGLVSLQLSQRNYLDQIDRAMTEGLPLLIDNLGDSIDAVIEPVVSRAFIYKGRKVVIKLGDKEVAPPAPPAATPPPPHLLPHLPTSRIPHTSRTSPCHPHYPRPNLGPGPGPSCRPF